jgi:hypothetical protein
MKKIMLCVACALLLMRAAPSAQTFTMPERIDKLSAKARESTNITLDGPLLQLAGMFLNSKDKDQAMAKNIISKLKGIHVRNFEFDKEGQYSESDLDPIRAQLKPPEWTRVVESREHHEHSQIFIRQVKGEFGGIVIISAESKELSIVSIDGPIDLKQLSSLGGNFGIPSVAAPAPGPGSAKDSAE